MCNIFCFDLKWPLNALWLRDKLLWNYRIKRNLIGNIFCLAFQEQFFESALNFMAFVEHAEHLLMRMAFSGRSVLNSTWSTLWATETISIQLIFNFLMQNEQYIFSFCMCNLYVNYVIMYNALRIGKALQTASEKLVHRRQNERNLGHCELIVQFSDRIMAIWSQNV